MDQPTVEPNPEFAFYYDRIRHKRARKRIQGYLYLIEAVGLFTLICLASINLLPDNPRLFIPLLLLMLSGLFLLVTGILVVRRGYQPITSKEIANQRRTERKQLFRYAQGAIPWRYWLLTIVIEMFVGLFFASMGIFALVVTFMPILNYGALFFGLSLPAGAYFLYDAIKRAKMSRQLADFSSRELASRLELGEVTEGL